MNMDRAKEITFLLLRIVAGLLFLQAGGMKLFDWFGGIPAEFGGHPPVMSQTWIGGVLEFYGGTAILLGLFTRPVAFILSGEMAVAYFQFHQPNGIWPIQNHGEPAVLLCFIFLFFAAHGGGIWSIDGFVSRRRHVEERRSEAGGLPETLRL
jgi:putative oxidoreductase